MTCLIYLDQNAWVALARGAWNKVEFPKEHAALSKVIEGISSKSILVPLTFANIYETAKINDPVRRENMARTQALISGGCVFRSRRRIFNETLTAYIAGRFSISYSRPIEDWFLSEFWFEAAGDYSPDTYGFEISDLVLDFIRQDPARAPFNYLAFNEEETRLEAVRRYSADSAELIAGIESRRAVAAGESLALRRRAYGANLVIDELDFILDTGRRLGLNWRTVRDIGSSLVRSIIVAVPILNVERELVVRLEDQSRAITENDLRDMLAFMTVIPFADVVVAEKPFVNLARQARLGEAYGTRLLTSIFEL